MKIQLIRNATMKITYAGETLVTDPMLSTKGAFRSFAGVEKNPTIELPLSIKEILLGVDGIIVSHTHPDHFDEAAIENIPKDLPIFCQPEDQNKMEEEFSNVIPIVTSNIWNKINIIRTGGKHGSGKILERMGKTSGYILQSKDEPTIYWIGDSIWCEEVKDAIITFKPDIIITHSGGAIIPGFENDPLIMNEEQTLVVAKASPKAIVVAIHMDSLDHCTVGRKSLRELANMKGISSSQLMIPKDGEIIIF